MSCQSGDQEMLINIVEYRFSIHINMMKHFKISVAKGSSHVALSVELQESFNMCYWLLL